MIRALVLVMAIAMLSGCGYDTSSSSSTLADVAEPSIAYGGSYNATLLNDDTPLKTTSTSGFNDPVVQNQNVVVSNPKKNCVTLEIDEKLVGKYVSTSLVRKYSNTEIAACDGNLYFEIKPDGSAEIALETFDGPAYYGPEDIMLTIYYRSHEDYGRVIINFNLVSGIRTFPASYGLSVGFEGDSSYTSFTSTFYSDDCEMKFVKQN